MKIGIYTEEVPASVGGGHVLRDDLVNAALQCGGHHSFEVISVPRSLQLRAKVQRRTNRMLGRPHHTVTAAAAFLSREVERRGLDMIWFNHLDPLYIGVPYILGIFDLQHRLQPWFPELTSNREWEQREKWAEAVRRAAIVTVGSPEAREQLCHFYGVPLENVHAIAFPTPQGAIDASASAPAGQAPGIGAKYGVKGPFLFYPAQFWPHKNHANLVLAVKALKDRGKRVSLVLTGSDQGNKAFAMKCAEQAGVADQVHVCGFVPYQDILAFYREALALSYVSFFGPENLPPLEAMALGCPVLLSDIPGAAPLHGNVPLMVDPRSPDAIAGAVERILDAEGGLAEKVATGKTFAAANNCALYMQKFQAILDDFAPIRRCWP